MAEATAFVVAAHVGIDTGSYSFPYIAVWAGQQEGSSLIKQVMSRVQGIAHQVIAVSIPASRIVQAGATGVPIAPDICRAPGLNDAGRQGCSRRSSSMCSPIRRRRTLRRRDPAWT